MALFSLIREINTGTTKWALRVRLVRMYLNPPRGKKEDTASYEMIFHDEEGDRIQAFMKTGVIKHFKVTLEEGSLYAIRNFVVHKNKSGFKITTCEFKLQFHRFTNIFDYENHKFPRNLYKFKDYSEFDCVNDVDENQLVDVIGRVVSYQPPVVASNISTRMDFRIQDLKNKQLTCSIWEEYVDKLLPFLENQTAEPVIISLQFARPKIFRGELKISNTYHITKLTVNGNDDEFLNFRERLNAKGNFSVNKVTSSIYYEIYDIFSQGNARYVNLYSQEASTSYRRRNVRSGVEENNNRIGINVTNANIDYWDIGDADRICQYCGAFFWFDERIRAQYNATNPIYTHCCMRGKISLPRMKKPPQLLLDLTDGKSSRSKHFIQNIRSYNSMFAFTSMGGKIDKDVNKGNGPPVFKLHGQNYHLIGSLLPVEGEKPKFAQLYIYDTSNEVSNRMHSVRSSEEATNLQEDIVDDFKSMLDEHNILVKSFRMAKEKIAEVENNKVSLKLIGRRGPQVRTYNLPEVSEVAALVVGDFDEALGIEILLLKLDQGL